MTKTSYPAQWRRRPAFGSQPAAKLSMIIHRWARRLMEQPGCLGARRWSVNGRGNPFDTEYDRVLRRGASSRHIEIGGFHGSPPHIRLGGGNPLAPDFGLSRE